MKKKLARGAVFALISCLALSMTACGDDSSGDATSPPTPGTVEPNVTVQGVSVSTPLDIFAPGGTYQMTAQVWGQNLGGRPEYQEVIWSVLNSNSGSAGTSISNTGLLTVAYDEQSSILVVKAESKQNHTVYGTLQMLTATHTVGIGNPIIVTPSYVLPGETNALLTAIMPGNPTDPRVTWRFVTGLELNTTSPYIPKFIPTAAPKQAGTNIIDTGVSNALLSVDLEEYSRTPTAGEFHYGTPSAPAGTFAAIRVEAVSVAFPQYSATADILLYHINSIDIKQITSVGYTDSTKEWAPRVLNGAGNAAVGSAASVWVRVDSSLTAANVVTTPPPPSEVGTPDTGEELGAVFLDIDGVGNYDLVATNFDWTATTTPAGYSSSLIQALPGGPPPTYPPDGVQLNIPGDLTKAKIKVTSKEDTSITAEQDLTLYRITGIEVRGPSALSVGSSSLRGTSGIYTGSIGNPSVSFWGSAYPASGGVMPQASATALNNLPAGLRAVRWDLVDTSGTSFLPWPATPTPTPQAAYVPVPAYTLPTGATLGEEFVSDTNPSSVILTLQNSYTGSLPATVQMQADRIVQDTTFTIGTPGTTPTRETVPGWVNINVNPVLKKFIVPTPIYLLRNALTGGSGFNFDTTIAGYGPGMWETDSPSIAYTVAGANLAANTTFTTSPTSVPVGAGNYGLDVDHSVNILVRRSTANANIPALSPSATNTPYSLTVAPQLGGVSPKTVPVVLWAWSSVAANVPNNPVVLSPGNNRSNGTTIINKPPAPVPPATNNFAVEQVGIKIFTTPALPWTPVSQNAAATLTDYNVVWSSPGANINFFTTAAGAQPAPAANVSFDTRDMKLYVAYNAPSGTYTLKADVKVYGEDPMDSSGNVVSITLTITVP